MLILRSPDQLQQVESVGIQNWLRQRFQLICDPEPYDADRHGYFVLVQADDPAESLETATGCPLISSLFGDGVYGDADLDFVPSFECIEDNGHFYELLYIGTDAGTAVVFVIPKQEGVDSRLLKLCAEFALPVESH